MTTATIESAGLAEPAERADPPTLDQIREQCFRACRLVHAADVIAKRFEMASEEEHMVRELLVHAVEESEGTMGLIYEALEAERREANPRA